MHQFNLQAMKFADYIKRLVPKADRDWLKQKSQMGSPHQLTKVMNDPGRATMHQLLVLSKYFGMTPYQCMQKWGLGRTELTEPEKAYIRFHYQKQTDAAFFSQNTITELT